MRVATNLPCYPDSPGEVCSCAKPAGRSIAENWPKSLTVIGLYIRSLSDTAEYLPASKQALEAGFEKARDDVPSMERTCPQ